MPLSLALVRLVFSSLMRADSEVAVFSSGMRADLSSPEVSVM